MTDQFSVYDSHLHTPLCNHAVDRPAAYAWQGCKRQLKGVIFTCHNPMPPDFSPRVRMREDQLDFYVELVASVKEMFHGMIDVRLGLECDWLPGFEDYLQEQTAKYDFDFILGSVHAHFPEYRDAYLTGDPARDIATYFELEAQLAETGLVDCLSHPDLIKVIYPKYWQSGYDTAPAREAFSRIAAADVSLEVNTSGFYKTPMEINPAPLLMVEAAAESCTFVLGSDSHQAARVGDDFALALGTLHSLNIHQISHYLGRERVDLDVTAALESLASH